MQIVQDNTGLSNNASTSGPANRLTSSVSSGSSPTDEILFSTSCIGGPFGNGFGLQTGFAPLSSGSSGNTSLGSSPVPNEEDVLNAVQQTAALLALNNHTVPMGPTSFGVSQFNSWIQPNYGCNITEPYRHTPVNLTPVSNIGINPPRFKSKTSLCSGKVSQGPLPPISGRKSPKPDSYKTVMCQAWLETGKCNFAENCRFAHGEEELRPCKIPIKNAKYKTKLCDKYTMTGLCPYGNRCLFIHPDANAHNAYIRPDRLAKMERERMALAALNESNTNLKAVNETPLTSRVSARPPPSWPLESSNFFSTHRQFIQKTISTDQDCGSAPSDTSPAFSAPSSYEPSPDISDRLIVLGDVTNRSACFFEGTPSMGDESSDAKNESPDSGTECDDDGGWSTMDSDPFHLAIANDNLARHLATVFSGEW